MHTVNYTADRMPFSSRSLTGSLEVPKCAVSFPQIVRRSSGYATTIWFICQFWSSQFWIRRSPIPRHSIGDLLATNAANRIRCRTPIRDPTVGCSLICHRSSSERRIFQFSFCLSIALGADSAWVKNAADTSTLQVSVRNWPKCFSQSSRIAF